MKDKFSITFNLKNKQVLNFKTITLYPLENALEDEHITSFDNGLDVKGEDIESVAIRRTSDS